MKMWFLLSLLAAVPVSALADYKTYCSHLLTTHYEAKDEFPPFWHEINQTLRSKVRTGWIDHGIPTEIAETVLEHSQKVRKAVLFYGANHPEINADRAADMALIHDLAEAIVPDYTPRSGVSAAYKHREELRAWNILVSRVGPDIEPLRDLWSEYEAAKTPTARLVLQLDKLDAGIQALKYEKLGYKNLTGFYGYAQDQLRNSTLKTIFAVLLERRFPHVNVYDQYYTLLKLDGNVLRFEDAMQLATNGL